MFLHVTYQHGVDQLPLATIDPMVLSCVVITPGDADGVVEERDGLGLDRQSVCFVFQSDLIPPRVGLVVPTSAPLL